MSFIFADSFDLHVNQTDAEQRGWVITGTVSVNTTTVKNGRACIALGAADELEIQRDTATTDPVFVSFWWRISTDPAARYLCRFYTSSGGAYSVSVVQHTDGTIWIRDNIGSRLGNYSVGTLAADIWYHFQIKFTATDSCSTGDVVVKVNGDTWIDLIAGEDTNYSTSANLIKGFGLEGNSTTYFDSFVMWDANGAGTWSDWIGMLNIETLYADGNGTTSDFIGSDVDSTDNYLHVDEEVRDGDTSYVESDTPTDVDLYTFGNLTGTISSIAAVQVVSHAEKDVAGSRDFKNVARVGSTNYQGSNTHVGQVAEYRPYQDVWLVDPDTAVAWIESGVNASEFGVEVTA